MKATTKNFDAQREFYTDEGCFINEISNSTDDGVLSIAQARVKPGVTTRWHRLVDTSERYCILSGRGLVEVGDLPAREVSSGDVVLIPPFCRQRISNTTSEDLIFLAICTPRFSPGNYQDLENSTDG